MFWQIGNDQDQNRKGRDDKRISVLVHIDTPNNDAVEGAPSRIPQDSIQPKRLVPNNNYEEGEFFDSIDNVDYRDFNAQLTPPRVQYGASSSGMGMGIGMGVGMFQREPTSPSAPEITSDNNLTLTTPIRSNTTDNVKLGGAKIDFPDLKEMKYACPTVPTKTPLILKQSRPIRTISVSPDDQLSSTRNRVGSLHNEDDKGINGTGGEPSLTYSYGDDDDTSSIGSVSTCASAVENFSRFQIDIGKKDGILSFIDENDSIINDEMSENDDDQKNTPIHVNVQRTRERSEKIGKAFELIPTKNQTHKDHQQKEFHQTRKACLEAAAEAYKIASLEVPDMILAQINEHRNQLQRKSKRNNSTDELLSKQKEREKKHKNIKRIKLCKGDEIHVAPCQCALRFVGMQEWTSAVDSKEETSHVPKEETNNDSISSLFGSTFFRGTGKSPQHVRTASILMHDTKFTKNLKRTDDKLVRTVSAQASTRTSFHKKSNKDHIGSKEVTFENKEYAPESTKGRDSHHSRSSSNLFTSLGYHEITLISNRRHDNQDNNSTDILSDGDLLPWDAITIRCSSHDELDLLIKLLKDSAGAKVVPFSSNPKDRLRQLRSERKRTENKKIRTRLHSLPMPTLQGSSKGVMKSRALAIPSMEKKTEENDFSDESRNDAPDKSLVRKREDKLLQEQQEKRKPWDLNFNKKEYCEVCDLTFTLLTRRHHCRECERSICGHCSTLLIVKGCDEKRYCNSCASGIVQKQSEALKGKLRMKSTETSLPGKVSDDCIPLGVGVVGRLPHWKTFLEPNLKNRPAVGRLTVEILEAIALPSVDMVNGKVDPYVRATITGYDRDMKWTLRQWTKENRYSLCSRFCTATLCPRWRGSGRKGGELLTLPVISTASAVLRLEVLHYNVLTNSRGKDVVLGTVEIPLSDIPNANLRHPGGVEVETPDGRKKNLTFDGYCDRWYRLVPPNELNRNSIILSKPIESSELKTSNGGENRKVGLQSLEEVGKRAQAIAIAPIEWIASAIKLDLPAKRPEAICPEHKARSKIHVRIKMNASMFGDIISHAWFPPVRPFPVPPPYDPEILLSRILNVGKLTAPYRKIIKFIEFCIKWRHEPRLCVKAYLVFALHLMIFPHLLPIFHIYLFIFLAKQSFQMKLEDEIDALQTSLHCPDSTDEQFLDTLRADDDVHKPIRKSEPSAGNTKQSNSSASNVSILFNSNDKEPSDKGTQLDLHSSPSLQELSQVRSTSRNKNYANGGKAFIQSSSNESLMNAADAGSTAATIATEEDDTKLNIAISWIAKRLGENKGLEILQFKLGMLGRDLRNINSVWDGSNPLLTRAAMVYLVISFILHFLMSQRLLWLLGTSTFYFSRSPFVILTARFMFGFWRGIAKATRRQQLLDAEILSTIC